MAKIVVSFGSMSGSISGTTYSKVFGGKAIARFRAKPSNPRSAAQSTARALFGTQTVSWSLLTDVQRQSWIDHAPSGVTGKAFYQKVNNNLALVGVAPIASWVAQTSAFTNTIFTASAAAGAATFTLTFDESPLDADHEMYIEATPPVKSGVMSLNGHYRGLTTKPKGTATGTSIQAA
jgi:hypothetical protein